MHWWNIIIIIIISLLIKINTYYRRAGPRIAMLVLAGQSINSYKLFIITLITIITKIKRNRKNK